MVAGQAQVVVGALPCQIVPVGTQLALVVPGVVEAEVLVDLQVVAPPVVAVDLVVGPWVVPTEESQGEATQVVALEMVPKLEAAAQLVALEVVLEYSVQVLVQVLVLYLHSKVAKRKLQCIPIGRGFHPCTRHLCLQPFCKMG